MPRTEAGSRRLKASWGWWEKFTARNPTVARRRTEMYERVRAGAMNADTIGMYFLLLQHVFGQLQEKSGGVALTPDYIYNMDEVGFSQNVAKGYVITRKGAKQVQSMSTGNRTHTTMVDLVSCSGWTAPPCFIVKGKRCTQPGFLADAPAGSHFFMAEKGYMTEEVSRSH